MERRSFLRNMSLATVPTVVGGYKLNAMAPNPLLQSLVNAYIETDHVLVVVQLSGGNDGINAVIPLDQFGKYQGARPNIFIPESKVLALPDNPGTGFNPALQELHNMYKEGNLKLVQAVGYPAPSFSHFRATDIWMSASGSDKNIPSGWAGRYLFNEYPNYPDEYPNTVMPDPLAIQIGSVSSLTFQAEGNNMGMAIANTENFYNFLEGKQDPAPNNYAGKELTFVRGVVEQTQKYNDVVKVAANKVKQQYANYPANNPLANQLKIVARLIAGGLKTRIYMVNTGGFDTHSNQVNSLDTTTGTHTNLLSGVSKAIDAFTKDLEFLKVADRVVGMTFSEFGRRIKSNASGGTDHGAAAPLFVFGKGIQSGMIGKNPDIPDTVSVNANVPMQTDFRSVYGTILQEWFCVNRTDIDAVLLNNFQSLNLFKPGAGCATVTSTHEKNQNAGKAVIKNFPNPFVDTTTIEFESKGGHTMIQIFDVTGQLVDVLVNQEMPAGKHKVSFDSFALPVGIYYARLQNGIHQNVRPMMKVRP